MTRRFPSSERRKQERRKAHVTLPEKREPSIPVGRIVDAIVRLDEDIGEALKADLEATPQAGLTFAEEIDDRIAKNIFAAGFREAVRRLSTDIFPEDMGVVPVDPNTPPTGTPPKST
jgi:hypothetical protein